MIFEFESILLVEDDLQSFSLFVRSFSNIWYIGVFDIGALCNLTSSVRFVTTSYH